MAEQTHGGGILIPDNNTFKTGYFLSNRLKVLFIITMIVVAFFATLATLGFGVYKISMLDSIGTFFDHILGNVTDAQNDHYIWDVRLPRALGALITGAGLAVAGAVMQNNFRNPLAEPYTMGISSGAFLGAVIAITYNITLIPIGNFDGTVGNAFLFSLIPLAIILLVSKFKKMTPIAMVLTGIAIMFLFSSICQVILVTAPSETLADAYHWRVGTLDKIRWDSLPVMAILTVVGAVLIMFLCRQLDVMYAGDRNAQTMGVNASQTRIVTLVIVSLMTAAVVSYTGTIGFIGLVGPHVARIFVGSTNRYLIPASATFGAAFVVFADSIAKVTGVSGLPVGVICALIGGPLFMYILIKQRKSAWA